MSGENLEIAAWVASLAALAAGVLGWFPWMVRNLRHVAFGDMLVKLLEAGNLERARKLCDAASPRPMALAVRACFDALDGRDEPEHETIERLREAYGGSMKASLAAAGRSFWIGGVALVCAAAAVYLVVGEGAGSIALVPAAIGAVAVVQTWRTAKKIAAECAEQGERLWPVMARTVRQPD